MLHQQLAITACSQLAEVRPGEHNLDSGNSPNGSEDSITDDCHSAHARGAVFGVLGGVNAIYTLLDLRDPRRLVPVGLFPSSRRRL